MNRTKSHKELSNITINNRQVNKSRTKSSGTVLVFQDHNASPVKSVLLGLEGKNRILVSILVSVRGEGAALLAATKATPCPISARS